MSPKKFSCRLKILRIAPESFRLLLLAGTAVRYRVKEHGLPADAEFGGAWHDPITNLFMMHVRSESFPEVADGAPIPFMESPVMEVVPDSELKTQNAKSKKETVTFHRARAVLTKR